ncbi:hypothetical protein HanXRQr2_Chr08g0349361 [Helianthus annuus]|uniref:Uncharacterized protein n=1 Tax=Helianthus annuus TaxID=4232 RepID=A0A9K3IG09_HELAN|nr:hypothetical protein HanXRQr2_Chr08g0349361 [Helianthus annuus]
MAGRSRWWCKVTMARLGGGDELWWCGKKVAAGASWLGLHGKQTCMHAWGTRLGIHVLNGSRITRLVVSTN